MSKAKKNEFWEDESGRRHAKLYPDVNEDHTLGFFHIPADCCIECKMKILPYTTEYSAYDPLSGAFMHYAADNNYCEECAKQITGVHRKVCQKTNIFAETVTHGSWVKEGWHETTYIKSPECEVSPEYDLDCEKIEHDPGLVPMAVPGYLNPCER